MAAWRSRVLDAASRRWGAQPRFLRFLLAAGASVPVNIASRIVFSRWVPFEVAVLLSHVVGMLTAYALTRRWVFASSGRPVQSELVRFAGVNVMSAALTWCVSVALVDLVFPRIGFDLEPELVGHVLGLAAAAVASFVGHSRFSFAAK
jgi:putative flippase GtrA